MAELENKNKPILNGWKQIAIYLDRGVRTVQRWEAELGLPIHRPHGRFKSTVLAIPSELDSWIANTPQSMHQQATGGLGADHPSQSQMLTLYEPAEQLRVLVVEDSIHDVSTCVEVLKKLGVKEVEVTSTVSAALLRFQEINDGKLQAPDLIILDLAFSVDSGFEVLRSRRTLPALAHVSLVVWSAAAHQQQKLCRHLGAKMVVPKFGGPVELERALISAGLRSSSVASGSV